MDKMTVDGHPDLYRDTKSGAIVNKNTSDYESYMKTHRSRMTEKERLSNMENDLNDLKTEITEIKNLIKSLAAK